ncbi:hypothetical protein EJ08DRAFT_665154 [Tothia fuscella]|uniref:Uncharacterized protein n=1 Tax=Tothia fuscella TaxID=1048955 RepID=A0A9P4TU90_9PEZI|nr:hypothetical protein EJ08DRAFT_665154 [Tothia fuscella]
MNNYGGYYTDCFCGPVDPTWNPQSDYDEKWGCDETEYWEERAERPRPTRSSNLLQAPLSITPSAPSSVAPSIAPSMSQSLITPPNEDPPQQRRGPVIIDFDPVDIFADDQLTDILTRQCLPKPITVTAWSPFRKVKDGQEHEDQRRLWRNLHRQLSNELKLAEELGTLEGWEGKVYAEWWGDTEADRIDDQECGLMEVRFRGWVVELIRRRVGLRYGIDLEVEKSKQELADGSAEEEERGEADKETGLEQVDGEAATSTGVVDDFGTAELEYEGIDSIEGNEVILRNKHEGRKGEEVELQHAALNHKAAVPEWTGPSNHGQHNDSSPEITDYK